MPQSLPSLPTMVKGEFICGLIRSVFSAYKWSPPHSEWKGINKFLLLAHLPPCRHCMPLPAAMDGL